MSKARALVTGAGGMLGSAVVPAFRDHGYEVLLTSRTKNSPLVDRVLNVTDFGGQGNLATYRSLRNSEGHCTLSPYLR